MPYVDPQTIHDARTGRLAPSTWGDVVRDDLEFLVEVPTCVIENTAAVSVTNATDNFFTANTEHVDTDGMHSTVSLTGRITMQTAGWYYIFSTMSFSSDADGVRLVRLRFNGSTIVNATILPAGPTNTVFASGSYVASMTAGGYVEASARHSAGNNINCRLVTFGAYFLSAS